jgi:glycyl-tRNA synthetase beta chain
VALDRHRALSAAFAGDALPSTETGTAVALADKLETLVVRGIGLQPTGEKRTLRCAATASSAASCACWWKSVDVSLIQLLGLCQ